MNARQAKEWLPLIQALAEGKTLQISNCRTVKDYMNGVGAKWEDIDGSPFSQNQFTSAKYYRIKPEPKKEWYRVALWKGTLGCRMVTLAIGDYEEKQCEDQGDFVRWLTDRIEYELPEGEV